MAASDNRLRVILLGRTGAGKSSLGNTLLGDELFRVVRGMCSGTETCEWNEKQVDDICLEVTDTPGLCDTHRSDKEVLKEIAKSVAVAAPGPHIVLMVLRADKRFTDEDFYAYNALKKLFGDDILKFMIVVFAGMEALGETAEKQQQELSVMMRRVPNLEKVMSDVHGQYFGVSNVAPRDNRNQQARQLLAKMKTLIAANGGNFFSNPLYKQVSILVEKDVEKRVQEGNTTHEAFAETRRDIVEDKSSQEFWGQLLEIVLCALKIALTVMEKKKAPGGASQTEKKDDIPNLENCSLM